MKLYYLLKNINCRVLGNPVVDITGLFHKDTEVKDGGMFFCVRGLNVDGNNYAMSAIRNGAVAIVTEQELKNIHGITQIIVRNTREAMSLISSRFYGNPANKLKIIGVTGTNGKTTITNMMYQILKSAGKRSAVFGTNGIDMMGTKIDTGWTTPDPIELNYYLSIMVKNKIEYVCMEVSAHAIDLKKIEGIVFETLIFTNLTEDHLDYFKTIDRYFATKASIFNAKYTKFAVLNIDNEFGKMIMQRINVPYFTYATSKGATVFSEKINQTLVCQTFKLNGEKEVKLSMLGRFNVSNALACIATARHLGIDENVCLKTFENLTEIDGRFNKVIVNGVLVIVDFAHTPDGLANILNAARELASGKKLISVFGCGGNRETQKRAIMGEISSKIADFSIITTDNPRFEPRDKIAKDIESGMVSNNYLIELDRGRAIEKAILMANPGDVIVVAGKGAETYIDENGTKIPYNDLQQIEKIRSKK